MILEVIRYTSWFFDYYLLSIFVIYRVLLKNVYASSRGLVQCVDSNTKATWVSSGQCMTLGICILTWVHWPISRKDKIYSITNYLTNYLSILYWKLRISKPRDLNFHKFVTFFICKTHWDKKFIVETRTSHCTLPVLEMVSSCYRFCTRSRLVDSLLAI